MKNKNPGFSILKYFFIISLFSGILSAKNLIANSLLSNKVINTDLSKGNIDVVSPGSTNRVDGHDLYMFSTAFGSKPGDTNWNILADLDGNSVIDGNDLVVLAVNFGREAIPDCYTIKITAGAGGSITPADTVTLKSGSSQTFTITPVMGYHVEDVKINGSSTGAVTEYTFNNITSNQTIEATFAINTYTITALKGIHGKIIPAGITTVNHGESKTLTIIPDEDSHIVDVKLNNFSIGAVITYTFTNVTSDHMIEADFASNSIIILSPTGQNVYSTKNSIVSLSGLASDDQGLSGVIWSNDKGGNGTASGLADWSVSGITLAPGDNTITVAGNYLDGGQTYDSINITYNPSLEFLSDPHLEPDFIFINEDTTVVVRIEIESNPNLDTLSVRLLELDSSNNVIDTTTALYDNGDLTNGDDIAFDGVYSGKVVINRNTKGKIKFRVSADTIDSTEIPTNYSEIFSLSVIAHLTDEEFSIALDIPKNALQKYNEFDTTYGKEEARTKTVEWLKARPEVAQADESEACISYVLKSGIVGDIFLNTEDTGNFSPQQNFSYIPSKNRLVPRIMERGFHGGTPDPIKVLNKNVLVINLFESEEISLKSFDVSFPEPTFETINKYNEEADVNAFKTLGNYGVIVLQTHGGFHDITKQIVFVSGELVDDDSERKHEADLNADPPRIGTGIIDGKIYFTILPEFINYYAKKAFHNSVIYAGACFSAANNTMWGAFVKNGAKTYFGYSNSVDLVDEKFLAYSLFNKYLVGLSTTTGVAYEGVKYITPLFQMEGGPYKGNMLIECTVDTTRNIHSGDSNCRYCHFSTPYSMYTFKYQNAVNGFCLGCHPITPEELMHPMIPNLIDCLSCHNPHYQDSPEYLLKEEPDVLCDKCHITLPSE